MGEHTQERNIQKQKPKEKEEISLHRRNIVRCNRLMLLEGIVLLSLVIALVLSFVLK